MNTFFLIFLGLPAFEIFLMIKIGSKIGAINTIALIFLTAIVGVYYARIQGIQALRTGLINLYQNKVPVYELLSGASIALAALITLQQSGCLSCGELAAFAIIIVVDAPPGHPDFPRNPLPVAPQTESGPTPQVAHSRGTFAAFA